MSPSFDRVADEYDATRGGEARGVDIAADIEPRLAGGLTLEIGVGTGVVARALRDGGREVVGIDISPAMLRHARQRLGPRVAVADAGRLPFRDGAFGDVVAVWVMHAVADRAAVLREVARVLRPGGRFVVCTSDAPEPDAMTGIVGPLLAGLRRGEEESHDPEALATLAEANGFVSLGVSRGTASSFVEDPAEVADAVERRSFSWCWSVPDEQWRAQVEPAIAALRALGRGPVRRVRRERLLVLERPSPPAARQEGLERFLAARSATLERVERGMDRTSVVALARRPLAVPRWRFWRTRGRWKADDHLYELYFVLPAADRPDVLALANRCDDSRVQASRISNASGRYRNRHLETLYGAACNLLRILEAPASGRGGGVEARALAQVSAQLTTVEDRFQWVLHRNATVAYLRGVALGLAAAVIPAVALLLLSLAHLWPPASLQPALLCFAGGAVTASTNALLRMTQGTVSIVGSDSHLLIAFYGSFRPFIGAVLAVVLYAMVSNGLVNLPSPTSDHPLPGIIIAFAAGFSEGLVPDLVSGLKLGGGGR